MSIYRSSIVVVGCVFALLSTTAVAQEELKHQSQEDLLRTIGGLQKEVVVLREQQIPNLEHQFSNDIKSCQDEKHKIEVQRANCTKESQHMKESLHSEISKLGDDIATCHYEKLKVQRQSHQDLAKCKEQKDVVKLNYQGTLSKQEKQIKSCQSQLKGFQQDNNYALLEKERLEKKIDKLSNQDIPNLERQYGEELQKCHANSFKTKKEQQAKIDEYENERQQIHLLEGKYRTLELVHNDTIQELAKYKDEIHELKDQLGRKKKRKNKLKKVGGQVLSKLKWRSLKNTMPWFHGRDTQTD